MDIKPFWIVEDFYPSTHLLRQKIEEHFTESIAVHEPFASRAIWNYWHIPGLYTYLRALPNSIYPGLHTAFMEYIRNFAAQQFGMITAHTPYLSMYINGCGQNIHNDAKNGRLAYVFSLTRWKERHFTGGETLIYKLDEDFHQRSFSAAAGPGFYHAIEPAFNRLTIFDDRLPHAVNPIQGSMNPLDARFVLHGHMEEASTVPYVEGGLAATNLSDAFAHLKQSVTRIFESHGYHGFITIQAAVEPSGITAQANIKHMQLMPLSRKTDALNQCLNEAMEQISGYVWPSSASTSKMVFALSSAPLRNPK